MARKKINVTVNVCDVCGNENRGYICVCCCKEHCWVCRGVVPGCEVSAEVCKNCDDLPAVQKVCEKYAGKFVRLKQQRAAELQKAAGGKIMKRGRP